MVANTTVLFGVVNLTYILFRVEPKAHEVLLNAVALDFLSTLDQNVVSTFSKQPAMRHLLREAQEDLINEADRMIQEGVLHNLEYLSQQPFLRLVAMRTSLAVLEVLMRLVRRVYFAISFAILVLAFTGGHIAHTHIVNVLWFFGMVKNRGDSESSTRLDFLLVDSSKPDLKFLPIAIIMITLLYILFHVLGFFLNRIHLARHADSLRRERNLRQASLPNDDEERESADPVADVAGGSVTLHDSEAATITRHPNLASQETDTALPTQIIPLRHSISQPLSEHELLFQNLHLRRQRLHRHQSYMGRQLGSSGLGGRGMSTRSITADLPF